MDFLSFFKEKLFRQKERVIPASNLVDIIKNETERKNFLNLGVVSSEMQKLLDNMVMVGADRRSIYWAVEKSLNHPLMASAVEVYADTACAKSSVTNNVVWVEAKNRSYQYEIEKLFDIINLEEVIYDWTWTTCTYGDLFVEPNIEPGVGITSVQDSIHPLDTSRIDYNGRLVGFVYSPEGLVTGKTHKIDPPWSRVHFRILGAKKRRSNSISGSYYSEYRAMTLLTPDMRRISSKYGTSILNNALVTYQRLKLAEDSLLMARVSRSKILYLYKVAFKEGISPEAAGELIDQYINTLRTARALNTSGAGEYKERTDFLNAMEDIILPVYGSTEDFKVEKLGGEIDIRAIVDIDKLENQLASALRIPLPMLGGYTKEMPPALGNGSMTDLDIRFSKQAHRVQRAMINGITRLIQIHLAAQKKDPDLNLFEVKMAETSSAAEQQIRESLDRGADVVTKVMDVMEKAVGDNYDKLELLEYLNQKVLKLNDLDFRKLITVVEEQTGPVTTPEKTPEEIVPEDISKEENPFAKKLNTSYYQDADLKAFTSLNEAKWENSFGKLKVKVTGK